MQNTKDDCPYDTTMATRISWSHKTKQPLELGMIFVRISPIQFVLNISSWN